MRGLTHARSAPPGHPPVPASQHDLDIGADAILQRYARAQRLASWPLYQATNLLVDLYTNDRAPVKLLRNAGLRLAQGMRPLRWAIARHLTQPDHV